MNALAVIGYPLLAVATLNLCIGILLFARRAQNPVAGYAAAMGYVNAVYCWVIGMAYVRASYGMPYELYYRAAWVGWIGMAPMAQVIFALRGDPAGARRWGIRLYALWGSIWVLCLTTDLIEAGAVSLVPFSDRVGPLEQPARALGALTLCWALVQLYRVQRASVGRRRQQNAYLLFGLAVYGAAGLLLAGVAQLALRSRFDPGLVSYFSIAWMAFTLYAITRHRLFDIRFVLARTVSVVLLTALLLAIQVALYRSLSALIGVLPSMIVATLMAGVALFGTPMISLLERRLDALLAQRKLNYRRALKETMRALASLGTVDDVSATLLGTVRDTVQSTTATLLLRDGDTLRLRQSYGATNPPHALSIAASALARRLDEHPFPLVREEQELQLAPERFQSIEAELRAFAGEVAIPIRHGGQILGVLIVGPKSDRDAFLQADLDLLETLASEAALAISNARLMEELQQAVRARDDFVSIAGHELRTPLNALHMNMTLIQRMMAADAPIADRVQAAERQIRRLTRLTDELLNVSRITAGRMTLEREPTDLGDIVRTVAARLADEVTRSGSQLDLRTKTVVGHWDALRIEQIVTNLLSNALKYAGGKPVQLVVDANNTHALLTVRDEGIGIDPADHGRIFGRFERAVTSQRVAGFGLGLWITKQMAEAHGGSVYVQSTPGAGATFLVELPLK